MANIDDELKAIDAQPQQGGGIDAALAAIDQQQQPQSPWWSWARIKQAYESSPEIADVRPVLGKLGKNAAIGAAEGATGLAELIPGNTYAVKETQALEKASDPEWQYRLAKGAGYAAPFLLGGGGGLAARLVPDAEKGASFLTKLVTGAKKGVATGGAMGAARPTGEEDTGKRYLEKGFDTAVGAGGGAVLGTAGAVGENAAKLYNTVTGKTAEEAAEGIRSSVSGKAAEAIGGKSSEEMRLAADEQQFQAQNAKAAADKISQQLASNPIMDQTQISNLIRKSAQDIYNKGDQLRRTQSGIQAAMDKYGDNPIVDVGPIRQDIEQQLKRVAPESDVAGALKTMDANLKAQGNKISLYVADNVRKELRTIISTKMVGLNNGNYRPVNKEILSIAKRAYRDLSDAAGKAAPEYKEAMNKYRELSRPLDWLERKGALAKSLQTDEMSGDYSKLEGGIIRELVNKARQGDTSFQKLMAADPGLKDSARKYFAGQLFGGEVGEKAVDPARMAKFINENGRALKQLGLYDEFSTSQKALQSAKDLEKRTAEAVETAEGGIKDVQKYEDIITKLKDENLSAKDVTSTARQFVQKLRDDNQLSQADYDKFLGDIKAADDRYEEKALLQKVMWHILAGAVAAASFSGGWELYRILRARLYL